MFDRIPVAIGKVLSNSPKLVDKKKLLDESYYNQSVDKTENEQGYLSMMTNYTWSTLFGAVDEKKEEPAEEYVNIQLLETMSTNILQWFEENKENFNSNIIEFGVLRKVMRKALTANSYEDVE